MRSVLYSRPMVGCLCGSGEPDRQRCDIQTHIYAGKNKLFSNKYNKHWKKLINLVYKTRYNKNTYKSATLTRPFLGCVGGICMRTATYASVCVFRAYVFILCCHLLAIGRALTSFLRFDCLACFFAWLWLHEYVESYFKCFGFSRNLGGIEQCNIKRKK